MDDQAPRKKYASKTEGYGKESYDIYLADIRHIPLLTREEERHYAELCQSGDLASRQKMILSNLRLVINIAKRYLNRGLGIADLTAEGNLGLIHALKMFDPQKGYRFSTYATWWVKHYIEYSLIKQGKTVRLPVDVAKELKLALSHLHILEQQFQLSPARAIDQVAEKLKRSRSYTNYLLSQHKDALSLNTPTSNADNDSALENIIPCNSESPDENLANSSFIQHLYQLIKKLPKREYLIISRRFDFNCEKPPTLDELGKELGLTRERVRQLEKSALAKIKQQLENENIFFHDLKLDLT